MTKGERQELQIMAAYMGKPLTEEQMELASDFTKNTISFSDPGTGKTHTLIAGILLAQTYHGVRGSSINCMSFTKNAVSELKGRYDALCKKVSKPPTANFNTFHRLSRLIMKEAYPTIRIKGYITNLKEALEDMVRYIKEVSNEEVEFNYAKKVMRAVDSLNSSLIYAEGNIARQYAFVELGMKLEDFQEIRKKWFLRGIISGTILQGDIPLYCLYALKSKPDIVAAWKGKYEIMIVDEFQDLSLLHLAILAYIAKTLIVIGDMKQQIYYFNGACPRIVQEYMKMKPDARVCNLTKSFRCKQEIADFSTKVILPNDESVKVFDGIGTGGSVSLVKRANLDWGELATAIREDIDTNTLAKAKDVMFLYRNTASALPIIDKMYSMEIPFRCSKFRQISEIPMFDDLCKLASAAWQPTDFKLVLEALKLFPEFEDPMLGYIPGPALMVRDLGKSLFELNFRYKKESSNMIIQAMKIVHKKIEEGKSAGIVFSNLLEVYDKYILAGKWWKLDKPKEFYLGLVAPIANTKTYPQMMIEETDKAYVNQNNINASMGIRCYTMHSSKGLEADDIYILDCDEGTFPNSNILKRKMEAGCYYDAANDVRSERNLLYVAITRAKNNCIISYSNESPTTLVVSPDANEYNRFDEIYNEDTEYHDDTKAFYKLFRLGEYNNKTSKEREPLKPEYDCDNLTPEELL